MENCNILSRLCHFKVKLDIDGAKYHKRNQYFNHKFVYLVNLNELEDVMLHVSTQEPTEAQISKLKLKPYRKNRNVAKRRVIVHVERNRKLAIDL